MLQAIERYMKQAIVDRNPSVASAALVSALVGGVHACVNCILIYVRTYCCGQQNV